MLTLIILDNGEPSVIKLTYENLHKEIRNIPNAEIVVSSDWLKALEKVKTKFVCFVEADCLVSSGYFDSLLGHIKKNPQMGHLAVLSTTTSVKNWAVKFFGYNLGDTYTDKVVPNKVKKQTNIPFYTIQVAYIPGAVIRTKLLKEVVSKISPPKSWIDDLVFFSTQLSLGFWRLNWMVYIAPNSSYCTTEGYVNSIANLEIDDIDLIQKFARESI